MPIICISGEGREGKGRIAPNTDLMLFEGMQGGASVQVTTNIPGTTVIVVSSSYAQLHGCIKSGSELDTDHQVWTTRIIPFKTAI